MLVLVYAHVRDFFFFLSLKYFPSLSLFCPQDSLLASFFATLRSLFLVTVYPAEGSGKANRLSLPCGLYLSASNFCLLPLFLYFPSSLTCLHASSLNFVYLSPFSAVSLRVSLQNICLTHLFLHPIISVLSLSNLRSLVRDF